MTMAVGWGGLAAIAGFQRQTGSAAVIFVATVMVLGLRLALLRLVQSLSGPSDPRFRRARVHFALLALLTGCIPAFALLAVYPNSNEELRVLLLILVSLGVSNGAHNMGLVKTAVWGFITPQASSLLWLLHHQGFNTWFSLACLLPLALIVSATTARQRSLLSQSVAHQLDSEGQRLQLFRRMERADAASVAKSRFLATMSHEIRTPMNGVLGALGVLHRSKLPPEQLEWVRVALSTSEALMKILNEVLDYSRIESNELKLDVQRYNLHAIVSDAAALFRASAQSKGLELRIEIQPDVPIFVMGDSLRLRQVLLNLVGNAVKFTDRGTISVRVSTMSRSDLDYVQNEAIRFEVVDTGRGISAEAMPQLFDAFYQADQSDSRTHGGTGLGLSICKRLVEALNGSMEVSSGPGLGSTFAFNVHLPVADNVTSPDAVDASPSPRSEKTPHPAASLLDAPIELSAPVATTTLQGLKILLAEDNQVNRLIANEALCSMGAEVTCVDDGAGAVEFSRILEFDAILMDVQMPNVDGYDATKAIRSRERGMGRTQVPIIALTASALESERQGCLSAGMNDYLAKPYSVRALANVILKCIGRLDPPSGIPAFS